MEEAGTEDFAGAVTGLLALLAAGAPGATPGAEEVLEEASAYAGLVARFVEALLGREAQNRAGINGSVE